MLRQLWQSGSSAKSLPSLVAGSRFVILCAVHVPLAVLPETAVVEGFLLPGCSTAPAGQALILLNQLPSEIAD